MEIYRSIFNFSLKFSAIAYSGSQPFLAHDLFQAPHSAVAPFIFCLSSHHI